MIEIRIDGVLIKEPCEFSIERYNLTKAGRVASGKMMMELIAKKRKFLLRYTILSGTELNHILSLIDTNKMFFKVEYYESGSRKSAICYAGHIPSQYFRGGDPISPLWYWRDVNFDLIEQ